MGRLVYLANPLDQRKRLEVDLPRTTTVRRLVQKHPALRPHTAVIVPGGAYGRRKVREFRRPTVCYFNDRPLTRREWKRTTVGPNDIVTFFRPMTGGKFNPLTIIMVVAAIAIAVAAPYLAGLAAPFLGIAVSATGAALGVGGALLTAGIGLGLSAMVYGLTSLFVQPPAKPTSGTGYANATPASSPVYNITAQGNYARLQQVIPEVFGRNRLFPDFVTSPYATFVNDDGDETNDQYLHHLLGLGIGYFEIDEDSVKLGDTPISSFPDIEWQVVQPGDLSPTSIVDERWITSKDLADVELLDANEGSPWAGPYAANPAGTTIDRIDVNTTAPRGLWAFNAISDSHMDAQSVVFEVEAQLISDLGVPIGDPDVWETYPPIGYTRVSQDPQRFTASLDLPSPGRWQVRVRRTDPKNPNLQAGHQLNWSGLMGRVIGRRRFNNITCIAVKMKAGSALSSANSRQFNLVATRKLETWYEPEQRMTTLKHTTRSPCDAFAYIARSRNGGRLADADIALAELYAHKADFEDKDWTFDFVFDSGVSVSEALGRVARSVIADCVTQGYQVHLIRDLPTVAPVAMYSQRNMLPGTFSAQYVMPDSTSPDCLIGTFIDQTVWQPVDVTVAFEDSAQERPTKMTLHGVGNRAQAWAILWNLARSDRYRRSVYAWSTAAEGTSVTYGDGISMSHDVPNYGQTLEVIAYDDTVGHVFTLADPPSFDDPSATYYAAVRNSSGLLAGPFVATPIVGYQDRLALAVPDPGDLPEILTGGDRERTWLQLGPGEAYSRPVKVKLVTPRDQSSVDLVSFYDDPRVYDELPVDPDADPIGSETPDLAIAITSGSALNLRTIADANGYSGKASQAIAFTIGSGVSITNGLVRGSWPVGVSISLAIDGTVTGAAGTMGVGGAGGVGPVDGQAGTAGGRGGIALDARSGPMVLTGNGTLRGGKGGAGGGGGGGGGYYVISAGGEDSIDYISNVAGGNGGDAPLELGSSGTTAGPVSTGRGGDGGTQGDYGSHGTGGTDGLASVGGIANGAGGKGGSSGSGGSSIAGVDNVDVSGFVGTLIGGTS